MHDRRDIKLVPKEEGKNGAYGEKESKPTSFPGIVTARAVRSERTIEDFKGPFNCSFSLHQHSFRRKENPKSKR